MILGFVFALFFILILILIFRERPIMCDDYEETVITTHEEPQFNIVGNLKRQVDGIQSFVIDPVDGQKI